MKKGPIRLPKAYLAGPMTGYPEHNFPMFRNYTKWLRNHGYDVVSPEELETAEGEGPRKAWSYYLVRDLRELLGCDCIAVLPGWQKSRGATLEVYVGWRLGFSIFDARDFTVLDVSSFNFAKAGRIPESNADSFIKAFCPPVMKRSISDVAKGSSVEQFEVVDGLRYAPNKAAWDKMNEPRKPENILKEADRIVGGDRNAAYGHPKTDFTRTAMIWSAILGVTVKPEQIPLCMIGVKMSRQCNAAKRDNWVDMAGYAQTGYMVDQKDGRME